jgi:hypothetical protein
MTTTKKKTSDWQVEKLPPNPFMSEILEVVHKQRSKAKKVEVLKHYRDDALTALLIWNFDPSVVSALPDGAVPYTPNEVPEGTDHTSLRREWKNLYHFIRGGNDGLNGLRRESMFVQMLEGLHPREADLVCLVKDKELTKKYKVTLEMVKEAYPDIVWGDRTYVNQS